MLNNVNFDILSAISSITQTNIIGSPQSFTLLLREEVCKQIFGYNPSATFSQQEIWPKGQIQSNLDEMYMLCLTYIYIYLKYNYWLFCNVT